MSRGDCDLVLFGATGFVGRLTAQHLVAAAPESVRIGLAGRDLGRLAEIREELGERAMDWPLLKADARDPASLDAIAAQAAVVATTVGPYARLGGALVASCAGYGTHYADLTGEVLFVRRIIEAYHDRAVETGARIVPSCGFDSVPSDLAVLLAAQAAATDGAGELTDTVLVVRSMRGGISGGTLASARIQAEEMGSDAAARRIVHDPYALSPDRSAEPTGRATPRVRADPATGGHVAPFVMAAYNSCVVRRSNALLGWGYGRELRYTEVMATGEGRGGALRSAALTGGLGLFGAAHALKPTRALLHRVLPGPGEGPSPERMATGRYLVEVHAKTASGRSYVVRFGDRRDPGYTSTAVMLGQSALALTGRTINTGSSWASPLAGVLTPAVALGDELAQRLRHNGFTIEVHSLPEGSPTLADDASGPISSDLRDSSEHR